jgi:ferrous iron transport protein A
MNDGYMPLNILPIGRKMKAGTLRQDLEINDGYMPLSVLPIGRKAKVKMLTSDGTARRRMLDLGLIIDTVVEAILRSPAGDPIAYSIRGAVIALRSEEAGKILVEAD